MKKTIRIIAFLTALIITVSALSSCFFEPNSNEGSGTQNKLTEVTVTLINSKSSEDIIAKLNQQLVITPPTKTGCYFTGYYDNDNGGTCYINEKGTSNSVWQKDFPSTLYAQWESISGMTYHSEVGCEDDPLNFGFYDAGYVFELPANFQNAIKGNLSETLKITAHFKAKEVVGFITSYADLDVKLRDGSGKGGTTFAKQTIRPGKEYTSYNLEFTTTAEAFKKGDVYLIFDLGYANTDLYIKDISITVSFV